MNWLKIILALIGTVLVGNGGYNAYQTNANTELTQEQRIVQWAKYGAMPAAAGVSLAVTPLVLGSMAGVAAGAKRVGGSLAARAKQALSGLNAGEASSPLLARHETRVDGVHILIEYDEEKLADPKVRASICGAVMSALEVRPKGGSS
jgi:hypothetical protein